ncbi:type II toxin-antitoxin system HicA family toxin [Crocosphaera sp. XPORK-15E]|uniref:type II toxin-antitoxin system HicA family toxin n=1 Tax=Crocosphaera sp. XPORK-15E TaxID=3110247 RepID=UPI002B21D9D1|nr:type II toxin-antitoxin system HicA family toxin [Crocosphaera sp. XPORK-15E]MEA5532968.1 type II toxin-antitoxin system HicA family toxin [Crocosphaera sp. XPORK-15E]
MRVLSALEVCKILKNQGFIQVRQRGSHIIMQKQINDTTITVPIPNYNEIRIAFKTIKMIFSIISI